MPALDPIIPSRKLAALLGMTERQLGHWRREKLLVEDMREGRTPCYDVARIDALLAEWAVNFPVDAPPTLQALEDRRLVLIDSEEAARITQEKARDIPRIAARGTIRAIKFPNGVYAFCPQSAMEYFAANNNPLVMLRPAVGHVLGLSRNEVKRLCNPKRGILAGETLPGGHHPHGVYRSSLCDLLTKHMLPDWIGADEWIAERETSENPLLEMSEAMALLKLTQEEVIALIEDQRLRYLQTPGKEYRITAESVATVLKKDAGIAHLSHIFGTPQHQIIAHIEAGDFRCRVHAHASAYEFRSTCIIELLQTSLAPGMLAKAWFEGRLRERDALLSHNTTAEQLGLTPEQLAEAISRGVFKGVKGPDGMWYLRKATVEFVRAKYFFA